MQRDNMRKLLLISILIVVFTIFTGCIGSEKEKDKALSSVATTPSQTTVQKSGAQESPIILKLSDVPEGFKLEASMNFSAPKTDFCTINSSLNCTMAPYQGNVPAGNRFIGNMMGYADESGRKIRVKYFILDTTDGIREKIESVKSRSSQSDNIGEPNVGDYSVYSVLTDTNFTTTIVLFSDKNYFFEIGVLDDKNKSLNNAINYAKVIESRISQ
ncbi:MAG: hypothetical protein O8C62_05390 [Candidatus Methanoperedens sp.]|nr:hypothetical protein [Candidatus Methanoperedens sp.]